MTPFYITLMYLQAQQTWDHDLDCSDAQLNLAWDYFTMVSDVIYRLCGSRNI